MVKYLAAIFQRHEWRVESERRQLRRAREIGRTPLQGATFFIICAPLKSINILIISRLLVGWGGNRNLSGLEFAVQYFGACQPKSVYVGLILCGSDFLPNFLVK
jgi:hypothetical protein